MINRQKRLWEMARYYFFISVVLLVFLFPFIFMVLSSFKNTVDIINPSKLLRFDATVANYINLFTKYNFGRPLKNSLLISFSSTVLSLLIGLPAAYAMAKSKIKGLQESVLVIRMIPTIAFLIPVYLMFANLKLVGTYTGIILAYMLIGVPFVVWVMIPYFRSIPKEMYESAMIDGTSEYACFARIMLPLAGPGIATVTIMSFINAWNNFMFGMILGNAKTRVLPTLIFNFVSHAEINWAGLMAGAVVVTLPIIVVSIFLQRYVVQGLTAGAVKG